MTLLIKHILVSLIALTFNFNLTNSEFVGKWVGKNKRKVGYVNFDYNGYASIQLNGKNYGGERFDYNGKKVKMTYVVNSSTRPIQLDFILTDINSGEVQKFLAIVKFTDYDTMQLALNIMGKRPRQFTPNNSVILKRD